MLIVDRNLYPYRYKNRRFFIVMKTVIQIGIRNWVLYDRAERTYRRIFKNIGQSDPVNINEYLSHFRGTNKSLGFSWNKKRTGEAGE